MSDFFAIQRPCRSRPSALDYSLIFNVRFWGCSSGYTLTSTHIRKVGRCGLPEVAVEEPNGKCLPVALPDTTKVKVDLDKVRLASVFLRPEGLIPLLNPAEQRDNPA